MKLIDWQKLNKAEQNALLKRPLQDNALIDQQVGEIIQQVKIEGDQGLLKLSEKFDNAKLTELTVPKEQWQTAEQLVLPRSIQVAIKRVKNYQIACKARDLIINNQDGIICQRKMVAIERVGLYVPGGEKPLISSLIMQAVPAKIAGCQDIVLMTPPDSEGQINPLLLATANYLGISEVYRIGGAQAIAAMAYGTETINKVDKIFGPGNCWVDRAKAQVSIDNNGAAIDLLAGPSEIMVIADKSADINSVAADLLSQAEHGATSQVLLVSTDLTWTKKLLVEVTRLMETLPRAEIIKQSLINSSAIIVKSLTEATDIANRYCPEHLSIQCESAEKIATNIKHSGAIFIGPYSAETMGDYINGSSHVLPTGGQARASSGASVNDYLKAISIQTTSRDGLKNFGKYAMEIAELEGLQAHALAVKTRLMIEECSNEY